MFMQAGNLVISLEQCLFFSERSRHKFIFISPNFLRKACGPQMEFGITVMDKWCKRHMNNSGMSQNEGCSKIFLLDR